MHVQDEVTGKLDEEGVATVVVTFDTAQVNVATVSGLARTLVDATSRDAGIVTLEIDAEGLFGLGRMTGVQSVSLDSEYRAL